MKVTHDKTSQDYLNKLASGQRDLVTAKKAEIKNVETLYDNKINQARIDGELELLDLNDRQNIDLNDALARKQEKLVSYKEDLENTRVKLQSEKENISTSHQERIKDLNEFYDDKFKTTYFDNRMKSLEVNDTTNNQLKDLQEKSNRTLKSEHHSTKLYLDKSAIDHESTIRNQEQEFKNAQKMSKQMYDQKVDLQKVEHNNNISKQHAKNNIEFKEREKIHANQLKVLEDHHKEILKQKNITFRDKYDTMANGHKSIIERMQQRFKSEVEGLVNVHAQYKEVFNSKSDDDFYHVSKLEPLIEDVGENYLISLEVPPHEKENVRFSAHDRKVSLSLTRRFTDRSIDEDGGINKSRRSEVFSKDFSVDEIVNPKKVTQRYQDGVLSFMVAKS